MISKLYHLFFNFLLYEFIYSTCKFFQILTLTFAALVIWKQYLTLRTSHELFNKIRI